MTIPLNNFPVYRPYTNITPFTVRDGATYLLQLETLLAWIKQDLVPHLDAEYAELAENWQAQVESLIENWETLSTQLIANVTEIAETVTESVSDAQAAQAAAELAQAAAETARDLAAQFASDAEDIQDGAVSTLILNASSDVRTALNGLYASSGALDAIADIINEGRLSEDSLDALISGKADLSELDNYAEKSVQDTVETGRLSPTNVDFAIEAGITAYDYDPRVASEIDSGDQTDLALKRRFISNEPDYLFSGWRLAALNQATATAKILCIGDSITEGTGVTDLADTWPYLLGAKIRAAYPDIPGNAKNSRGWSPIAGNSSTLIPPYTIANNGGGSNNTTFGFGFRNIKSQSIAAAASIGGNVVGTAIDIWYTKGTTTTAFQVRVDGVIIGSYGGPNAGGTLSGFKQRIELGASGTHAILIVAGSGASFINGITVYDGNENSGVVTLNAGVHGAQSITWKAAADNEHWKKDITELLADLTIIMIGVNDYSSNTTKATFLTNIRALVNAVRDSHTNYPSILIVSEYRANAVDKVRWNTYESALQQVARELGVGFMNLRDVMPDADTSEGSVSGYYADGLHPTALGNAKIADEISKFLIARAT